MTWAGLTIRFFARRMLLLRFQSLASLTCFIHLNLLKNYPLGFKFHALFHPKGEFFWLNVERKICSAVSDTRAAEEKKEADHQFYSIKIIQDYFCTWITPTWSKFKIWNFPCICISQGKKWGNFGNFFFLIAYLLQLQVTKNLLCTCRA